MSEELQLKINLLRKLLEMAKTKQNWDEVSWVIEEMRKMTDPLGR